MASLFDSDIPPWLRTGPEKAPWEALLEGSHAGSQIASNILHARSIQMQAEEQTAQVGNVMASTELKRQQLQETNEQNAAWLKVAEPVSKWLMTPDDRLDQTPTPDVGTSEKAVQFIEKRRQAKDLNDYRKAMTDVKQQQADNMLEVAGVRATNNAQAVKDKKEWSDAFNRLSKEGRSALLGQYPDFLDKDGVPLPKYHGFINDALGAEKQSKIGAGKPGTASEPEFFTDPQSSRRFMRWGNKHYDLSGVTPQQRTEIEVAKGDYNRAQKEYDKAVASNEKAARKEELMQNIFTARDNLSKLTKSTPSKSASPVANPVAPSTPEVFTDKSGKQFKYKGSASDPSTDKDPSHWEMIP